MNASYCYGARKVYGRICSSSSLFDKEGLMISATKCNIVQDLEKGKSPKELYHLVA